MPATGAMAGFAPNARLGGNQRPQSARGVAGEAAIDARHRVANFVEESSRLGQIRGPQSGMAGRGAKTTQLGEVAEVVLQIEFRVTATDKGDGLLAGAESPFHGHREHVDAIVDAEREAIKTKPELTVAADLGSLERPHRSQGMLRGWR